MHCGVQRAKLALSKHISQRKLNKAGTKGLEHPAEAHGPGGCSDFLSRAKLCGRPGRAVMKLEQKFLVHGPGSVTAALVVAKLYLVNARSNRFRNRPDRAGLKLQLGQVAQPLLSG